MVNNTALYDIPPRQQQIHKICTDADINIISLITTYLSLRDRNSDGEIIYTVCTFATSSEQHRRNTASAELLTPNANI